MRLLQAQVKRKPNAPGPLTASLTAHVPIRPPPQATGANKPRGPSGYLPSAICVGRVCIASVLGELPGQPWSCVQGTTVQCRKAASCVGGSSRAALCAGASATFTMAEYELPSWPGGRGRFPGEARQSSRPPFGTSSQQCVTLRARRHPRGWMASATHQHSISGTAGRPYTMSFIGSFTRWVGGAASSWMVAGKQSSTG